MRRLTLLISASAAILLPPGVAAQESNSDSRRHVVFLAGNDSHGWGSHKHIAGSILLSESLPKGVPGVTTQMVRKWPSPDVLKKADALVIYADGWNAHPANRHLDELAAFMDAGKGLVVLHWATGIGSGPKAGRNQKDDPNRGTWRRLMGADFEPFYSISNFYTANFEKPSKHPVMNGVPPFKLHDECYYHLRECSAEHGKVDPVLPLHPPASTIQKGTSAFRGNDIARNAIKNEQEQYCAWTYERPGDGKAFGFTGGHFHWNWARDEARMMTMNGILWAAGGNVPQDGVATPRPKAAQMLANMDFKNPGWTEEALQKALDLAQSGTPVAWGHYSNGPLPTFTPNQSDSETSNKEP